MPPLPEVAIPIIEGEGTEAAEGKEMDLDGDTLRSRPSSADPKELKPEKSADGLIPFEQSQMFREGHTFPESATSLSAALALKKDLPDPSQTLVELDEALRLAMEATAISEPGPIGRPFEAILEPEKYWNPLSGPPHGLGAETFGEAHMRLMPHLARVVQQTLLAPPKGHLSFSASGQSILSELVEADGADLAPVSWELPFKPFGMPAPQPLRPARGRGGYGSRGGRGRGMARQGSGAGTPRTRSPPHRMMSPTGFMSPQKGMFSPVEGAPYFPSARGGPGQVACICPPPARFDEVGETVECSICERWYHCEFLSGL
jgi:hypothetical protein